MAVKLGRTVAECKRDVTLREFAEFQVYYRKHPWDEDWDRTAWLAAVIINANPFRRGPPVAVADLLERDEDNPTITEAKNQAVWANVALHQSADK